MGFFGVSFEQKVAEAIGTLQQRFPAVASLAARTRGKVVTLEGEAASVEVKSQVMAAFNQLVETDNTINAIRVRPAAQAASQPAAIPAEAPPLETIHVVAAGDTLSALAQRYYGKASLYMKIFEANRDLLEDPDTIRVGQKLRVPR